MDVAEAVVGETNSLGVETNSLGRKVRMTRVALSALAAVAVVACADSSRPLGPGGAQPQVAGVPGYTIAAIGTHGGNLSLPGHINGSKLAVDENLPAAGQTCGF